MHFCKARNEPLFRQGKLFCVIKSICMLLDKISKDICHGKGGSIDLFCVDFFVEIQSTWLLCAAGFVIWTVFVDAMLGAMNLEVGRPGFSWPALLATL